MSTSEIEPGIDSRGDRQREDGERSGGRRMVSTRFDRSRLQGLAERIFGIDIRSLALFRVAVGLTLLADLFNRSRDLVAHYTDAGVLPRAFLVDEVARPWHLSLHLASGQSPVIGGLFLLAAVAAVLLILGWRTRWMTALSWLLLVSLQNRNPIVLQGGDVLLRMLLFWALFLPLGAAASIDRALDRSGVEPPQRVLSIGSIALLLQMAMMYLFSSILKTGAEWRQEGTALYYTFHIDQFATRLGSYLLNFPGLLKLMTAVALSLETFGPWLAFVPLRGGRLRTAVVGVFIAFHFSLFLTLKIGLFPFICMVGWLVFLPSTVWERLASRLERRLDRTAIDIYYDGACGFCKRTVLILRALLLLPQAQIRTAQEVAEIDSLREENNSWVVLPSGGSPDEARLRFDALAWVVGRSPIFAPIGWLMGWRAIRPVGNAIYRWVAEHRLLMGRATAWMKGRTERWTSRPGGLGQLVALTALLTVIAWNIAGTPANLALPSSVRQSVRLLRLDQHWNMFAPRPMRDDGWYVIRGVTVEGYDVDLFRVGRSKSASPGLDEVDWSKPERVAADYPTQRWRKYMMNLWQRRYEEHRPYFADWLCDQWNAAHPEERRINRIEIHFVLEPTPDPGEMTETRKVLLRGQVCPDV